MVSLLNRTLTILKECGADPSLNFPSPDWKGSGWYRIMGEAGTQLTEKQVEPLHCGAFVSGWLNGTHPTTEGEIVDKSVCFHFGHGVLCKWEIQIQIVNCGSYFLYNLKDMTDVNQCNLRYCSQ